MGESGEELPPLAAAWAERERRARAGLPFRWAEVPEEYGALVHLLDPRNGRSLCGRSGRAGPGHLVVSAHYEIGACEECATRREEAVAELAARHEAWKARMRKG